MRSNEDGLLPNATPQEFAAAMTKCLSRTDSDRYDELRALVEAWQSHQAGSSTALAEWRHQ